MLKRKNPEKSSGNRRKILLGKLPAGRCKLTKSLKSQIYKSKVGKNGKKKGRRTNKRPEKSILLVKSGEIWEEKWDAD